MAENKQAVVLGATSIVGSFLCERLADAGYGGEATSREPPQGTGDLPPAFRWRRLDARAPETWRAPSDALVFSLAPLPKLVPLLPQLTDARQIIALSTTSLFYKNQSSDLDERSFISNLRSAEQELQLFCAEQGIAWTLLRPTLIYCPGRDRNVTAIARQITRFGFFPVAAPGNGLRQPVHADDIAQAAVAALDNAEARNQAFTLPGGETLPYRDMVQRIFEALDREPRIIALPGALLSLAFRVTRRFTGLDYSTALFERMNLDLAFDDKEAKRVLGYAPRRFLPKF